PAASPAIAAPARTAAGSPRYPPRVSGEWLGTDVPLHAHHQRPAGMGLHICAVAQRGSNSASEYVEIVNDGAEPVPVTALELTDCCGEQHKHVYSFPKGELGAGKTAYVYTVKGTSLRTHTGDLMRYAGLQAPVWKDESHVAYLRHPDGRIIDTMRAGSPPRHPDGH
ncbi:MAG: lamin tail domain-containing protein, partial [Actinobacteria bacterium]|nr:lamin tail domain-containing protein [Actinomycetota bacterium]